MIKKVNHCDKPVHTSKKYKEKARCVLYDFLERGRSYRRLENCLLLVVVVDALHFPLVFFSPSSASDGNIVDVLITVHLQVKHASQQQHQLGRVSPNEQKNIIINIDTWTDKKVDGSN